MVSDQLAKAILGAESAFDQMPAWLIKESFEMFIKHADEAESIFTDMSTAADYVNEKWVEWTRERDLTDEAVLILYTLLKYETMKVAESKQK